MAVVIATELVRVIVHRPIEKVPPIELTVTTAGATACMEFADFMQLVQMVKAATGWS